MQNIFCLFFLLAAVVVVDPYIYKIPNNFLTCKLFFCLFLLRAPATRKKPSEKSPCRFAVVNR